MGVVVHAPRRTHCRPKVMAFSSRHSHTLQRCSCNDKISAFEFKWLSSFNETSFCLCTELILVGEAVNIGT